MLKLTKIFKKSIIRLMTYPNKLSPLSELNRPGLPRIVAQLAVAATLAAGIGGGNALAASSNTAISSDRATARALNTPLKRLDNLRVGMRLTTLGGETEQLVLPAGVKVYERANGQVVTNKLSEKHLVKRALYARVSNRPYGCFRLDKLSACALLTQPGIQEAVYSSRTDTTSELQPFSTSEIVTKPLRADLVQNYSAYHKVTYTDREALHVNGKWVEALAQSYGPTD
jgi:hypothetical protein